MKEGIHPDWYPEAKVVCACGNTWTVGATVPELRTDVCSECHPFFTGEQRIVDTEGQVERFMRRLRAREEAIAEEERRKAAQTSPDLSLDELGFDTRIENLFEEAGLETAGDILGLLEEKGDDGLTDIRGFGLKTLADVKRGLREQGFTLPGDEPAEEPEEAEAVEEIA